MAPQGTGRRISLLHENNTTGSLVVWLKQMIEHHISTSPSHPQHPPEQKEPHLIFCQQGHNKKRKSSQKTRSQFCKRRASQLSTSHNPEQHANGQVIRAVNPSSRQARPPSPPCPCRTPLFLRHVCLTPKPHPDCPHGSQHVDTRGDTHRRTTRAATSLKRRAESHPSAPSRCAALGLCERAFHRLHPHTAHLCQQHTNIQVQAGEQTQASNIHFFPFLTEK